VLVLIPKLEEGTLDSILDVAWKVGFKAGKVISVVPATFEEMKKLSASPFFRAVEKEVSGRERKSEGGVIGSRRCFGVEEDKL